MDLVFSWFADAGAWPEHPGSGCAVVDQEVVGPLRLLDHVETMLGLGRPEVAAVRRIAIYRRKIEAAGAGQVLVGVLRRRLVVGGSRASRLEGRSGRGRMAPASRSRAKTPRGHRGGGGGRPGFAVRDARIDFAPSSTRSARRRAFLAFRRRWSTTVLLPVGWRALLDALERCGTRIEDHAGQSQASPDCDLRRLSIQRRADGSPQEIAATDR